MYEREMVFIMFGAIPSLWIGGLICYYALKRKAQKRAKLFTTIAKRDSNFGRITKSYIEGLNYLFRKEVNEAQ